MVIYKPTIYDWIKLPEQDICSFLFSPSEYNQRLPLDRTAVIDGLTGRGLTYAQVKHRAERLAAAWQDKVGLKQGDIVAVFAPNQYDTVVLYLSLLGAKCTITPGNPYYTENEFLHQIINSGARALVTVRTLLPTLLKVCTNAGTIPKEHIFVFGESDGNDESSTRHVKFPLQDAHCIDPRNDVAFINYSSGTTGLAKGVMLTHHNIISQVFVQLAKDREIDKDTDIGIGFLPLYHIYGVTVLCFNALYKMLPLVIIPRFELKLFLELVKRYKITIASIVPPVAVQLAKDPLVLKYDLSVIRHVNSGAAPLDMDRPNPLERPSGGHPGSVGILSPNTECMIVDEQGNELGPDKEGEILLRGTSIMKGYLNNPEANAKVFTSDGWMRTGDVGRYDSKTKEFYIVDRLKELIKYNGFPVAPAELESLLSNMPEVVDCAVIGVYSHSQATELPLAFVVVRPGVDANKALEDKIKDYVASHVAGYKRLRGGVRFIDTIPKSPSGKILRRLLRDIMKRENMASSKL
ncbi:acetyl-CoA synthetase-like protein [Lichtheimia hyalospora FSU 10163]|nr:acetyl-CoA synthetase-like protein [Lichtheimia hyalospora FSU 10163]